jgi:hypothetical protein
MFLRSADTDDARWLKLLARWALLSGVFSIVVFALLGLGSCRRAWMLLWVRTTPC